ncbi:SUN domain-containing protein 2-like isoform X2 [Limanda limanda]|uniref:SUN domain-containing protein 2-like isoform X2 n=1 Tax=Limanda limanda TaxID=27771 RepID=UPI0029C6DEDB|nr:SUN domain-containing protein 2-like isoform X2 [Limanda limanda]
MSRLSLRLETGLLDHSLPLSSASYSAGGGSWRSSRSLKPGRSQLLSVSCSESLLLVPCPRRPSGRSLHSSSVHSVTSDTSLLSSLLDESSIQDATLVDNLWGLDHDVDPKESTIVEPKTVLASRSLIGSDSFCVKHTGQTLSRVYCKDCELHPDLKESVPTRSASSKYTSSSSSSSSSASGERELETSIVYGRERSRRRRTGVLSSMLDAGVNVSRRAAACVIALLSVICSCLSLQRRHHMTDVLQMWLDVSAVCVRRAAGGCSSVLTLTWQLCQRLTHCDLRPGARSDPCGVMELKETTHGLKEALHPKGSLCDDCKETQLSETDAVPSSSRSSLAPSVLGLMRSAAVFTGKTGGAILRWLSRRWHHMTAPDRPVLLTRFPPRCVLLLVPLLLVLIGPCWFGLAGLQSVLAALNLTDWTKVVSDVPPLSSMYSFMSSQSPSAETAAEGSGEELYPRPPPAEEEESARLVDLERSLTELWRRVEAAGQQAEQRHGEVLQLYADLQQRQVSAQSGEDDLQQRLSSRIDHELTELRRRLDEERQVREQQTQQQSLWSGLDQLQLLAAHTQEDRWRREAASVPQSTLPAAISTGVDRQSHDGLRAEVARLEAALEDVRREVDALSGFKERCQQLDGVQQTISEQVSVQVREELRVLVNGNRVRAAGGGDSDSLPESLLQWLSQQYVSRADLQVALSTLERSLLQNIKLPHGNEEVAESVLQTPGDTVLQTPGDTVLQTPGDTVLQTPGDTVLQTPGDTVLQTPGDTVLQTPGDTVLQTPGDTVTPEEVHVIVKNALRRFSQDQTGLADYALESGGGSVVSTRCSETFETKAALLSLFGLPLWYFSQSPRVVIQPDVHPGNCWAFRGSTGFLVIRLSMRILPSAFSMEHIPKALAPSGALHSAPRDFSVYGLDDEQQDRGKLLGAYTYDQDGEALQTYAATEENDQMFQILEVKVWSNWGHEEFTCVYRFRVHGSPSGVRRPRSHTQSD